jgi:hypothetical protein
MNRITLAAVATSGNYSSDLIRYARCFTIVGVGANFLNFPWLWRDILASGTEDPC